MDYPNTPYRLVDQTSSSIAAGLIPVWRVALKPRSNPHDNPNAFALREVFRMPMGFGSVTEIQNSKERIPHKI